MLAKLRFRWKNSGQAEATLTNINSLVLTDGEFVVVVLDKKSQKTKEILRALNYACTHQYITQSTKRHQTKNY